MNNNLIIKLFLIVPLLTMITSGLLSQGIYNNGARIVVGSGTTVYIDGPTGNYRNETNVTDGSVDLSGTLKITGNITNNVVAADILSAATATSQVALIGTTPQTIGGLTTTAFTFPDLVINNPGGIVLAKNAVVNGNMTFTAGLVNIGNNNFTFGLTAGVAGTPSSTSMIIATGTGQVLKDWSAVGSFTFPVGDNNITAKYSPVTLNFTAGTFAAGANAGLNMVNAQFADPAITGSYLNRYWVLTQTGITAFTCDAMFQYVPGDIVGTESNISTLRVVPAPFSVFNPANTTLHQLSATALTSFGTFTGGPGFKVLNLKLYLQGLYIGGGLMSQAQGIAGNQFTGTTVDQITVELHDPVTYLTTLYTSPNINLNTGGQASLNIPSSYAGSYYITVKPRNSIGVVTTSPVLFSSQTINYDFTTAAAQAFGSNQMDLGGGIFGLYSGDANGDGAVDILDLLSIQNDAFTFAFGYLPTDLNGDGAIDVLDMIMAQNIAFSFISFINP